MLTRFFQFLVHFKAQVDFDVLLGLELIVLARSAECFGSFKAKDKWLTSFVDNFKEKLAE